MLNQGQQISEFDGYKFLYKMSTPFMINLEIAISWLNRAQMSLFCWASTKMVSWVENLNHWFFFTYSFISFYKIVPYLSWYKWWHQMSQKTYEMVLSSLDPQGALLKIYSKLVSNLTNNKIIAFLARATLLYHPSFTYLCLFHCPCLTNF